VIPEIGVLIDAHVIRGWQGLSFSREPREHSIVLVCGVITFSDFSRPRATAVEQETAAEPFFFGVGSTKEMVIDVQGIPDERGPNAFQVRDALAILGPNDVATSWTDPKGILHVRK